MNESSPFTLIIIISIVSACLLAASARVTITLAVDLFTDP